MYAGGQLLARCHGGEAFHERYPFRTGETGRDLSLVRFGELADLGHELRAFRGQNKRIEPAVRSAPTAFDIAPLFEVVNERDDTTGQQAELFAERLLTAAGLDRYRAQNPRLGRDEVQLGDAGGKSVRRVLPELCQEERNSTGLAVRRRHG
jgi:hypothetical protein